MNLDFKEVISQNFSSYVQYINEDWNIPDFHFDLIYNLENQTNCLISLPPGHSKTTIATILYNTFFWGKNPDKRIIIALGSPVLASVVSIGIRRVLESEKYQAIFDIRLRDDSNSKKIMHTYQGGQLVIVSKGQAIGGIRGDLITFDDLVGGFEEAQSKAERDSAWSYLGQDLLSRKAKGCRVIGIGTRWHEDDVLCRAENNEAFLNYKVIKYKALNDNDEALWPEMYSLDDLTATRKTIGEMAFQALYQQNTTKEDGNIIKKEWIQETSDIPTKGEYIITADLAFKGKSDSDFNAIQCWLKSSGKCYLIDHLRIRAEFSEVLKHFKSFCLKHKQAYKKLVEDAANGSALKSVLSNDISGIILVKPEKDKIARVNLVTPMFEALEVFINKDLKDKDLLLHDWLSFPKGKNDDTIDAMTMALNYLRKQNKFGAL